MYQYLIQHALDNVWCNPRLDNQFVIAPKRVSVAAGALNRINIMDCEILFPEKGRRYHVYVVGQVDPWVIGLLRQVPGWATQRWFSFAEAMNVNKMEASIYTANGVMLPRHRSFYMFMNEQSLIFAVPHHPRFNVRWSFEQLYFRLYSGSWFREPHIGPERKMRIFSGVPSNNATLMAIENAVHLHKTQYANVKVYVNGVLVDRPFLGDTQIGDYVEWVGDDSVVRVHEWPLSELHKFRSELDDTYKYLLHHSDPEPSRIEYQDDVDVHVIHRPDHGFSRGLYYNRNFEHHHRMVTHRDYSIRTDMVEVLRNELERQTNREISNQQELMVQLVVRRSNLNRPLVFENQRIFELYKLGDQQILDAMVGLNAVVPEWNAVELERSGYTELMRTVYREVDIEKVEKAYGYNACSVILGQTPTKTYLNSGRQRAEIPYGLQRNATFYEFDANGLYLGMRVQLNDNDYEAVNDQCRLIEGVVGIGGDHTDSMQGQGPLSLPEPGFGYRVYRCFLVGGLPTENWEDVTGTDEYIVVNNQVVWNLGGNDHWLMVRTDKKFISYDYDHSLNDGLLNFTIMERPNGNPMEALVPMKVPMAQLDIFMNGRALIRGLDYYVQFPQVFITNRLYINQDADNTVQHFHIRMRSLPNAQQQLDTIEQRGWVLHNTISRNHIYDLKDDKVLQIIVGGRIMHRDDVLFDEERPGPNPLAPLNGLPYQIKDLIVPLWNFTHDTTDVMRAKSQEIDHRVSQYMTVYFGDMESTELAAIPQRYPVVSPFLSHILYLLRQNGIVVPVGRVPTDAEVLELCQPYETLLPYDPLTDTTVDDRFMYIVPHMNDDPYTLDPDEYRFFQRVIRVYTENRVDITEYVTVTP